MSRRDAVRNAEWELALDAGRKWRDKAEVMQARREMLRDKGPKGLETTARIGKFIAREVERSRGDPSMLGVERRFGPTLDYEYIGPVESQAASRSVARLVEVSADGKFMTGFATGFMASPQLLLTNWHVFPQARDAQGTFAQFGYEYLGVTLQRGALYRLAPERFFAADQDLDFALVAVDNAAADGVALSTFGFSRLIPTEGKILRGHGVNMIGYPEGLPKTYVYRNNPLIDLDDKFIRYLTDSDEGASGSPAYNPVWELIALHHRAVPRMEGERVLLKDNKGYWQKGMSTEDVDWVANEGTRVSVIVAALTKLQEAKRDPLLAELLQTAVDPVGNESIAQQPGGFEMPTIPANGVTMNFSGSVTINLSVASPPVAVAKAEVAVLPGVEAVIRFDPNYDKRPGYQKDFLKGFSLAAPHASARRKPEMLLENGKELVLDYHHYSLAMNKVRRLQMWSAVNVNYDEDARGWFTDRKAFGTDKWVPDPRIPAQYQIMDAEAYEPSRSLQRGHIVRRDDAAWGTSERNQEYANSDTFHWTNCTPQHGGFNQSSHFPGDGTHYAGIWGGLENKIATLAKKADGKVVTIFAGPVLADSDPTYTWGLGDIQIPMKYWKILVTREKGKLCAYGFVLDQQQAFDDLGFERMNTGKFRDYELKITEIEKLTGVEFDAKVVAADVN